MLQEEYEGKGKVEWMNDKGEQGLPYDLKLTLESGSEVYIEVKSTASESRYF